MISGGGTARASCTRTTTLAGLVVTTQFVSKLPVAGAFDAEYLEYNKILPLEIGAERLRDAAAGDPAPDVVQDLELSLGVPVELVPVSEEVLFEGVRRTFAASESAVELVRDLDAEVSPGSDASDGLADARDLANQPPVIRFVNLLIRDADDARASDRRCGMPRPPVLGSKRCEPARHPPAPGAHRG
jgi:hypothetical protein